MQAIMETAFDAVYLISVITIGIMMITKGKGNKEYTYVVTAVDRMHNESIKGTKKKIKL